MAISMFNEYNYLNSIKSKIPEIKTISRVTGLAGMEEAMAHLRSLTPLMLFVEDDGDGYLDLSEGNLDHGFHTFSIVDMVKLDDSDDRQRALAACMAAGLKVFKQMIEDSRNFKDPVYGFDRSHITYQMVGPLLNNSYGYMFTYTLKNERFNF